MKVHKITPLSKGDRVRVIAEKYLASKLRSNDQKMQARWSKRIYTVRTVKRADSDTGFMPEYILTISGDDDEDKADPRSVTLDLTSVTLLGPGRLAPI